MLQIAICDRSVEHAAQLEQMLHGIDGVTARTVEHFHTMRDFLARIEEPRGLDVVFFDVTFNPDMGLLLTRELNRKMPTTQVVFTSCYVTHAVDIADAPHIYFLVKPYQQERVAAALRRVKELIESTKDRRLLLPVRGGSGDGIVLQQSRIVYFERMRRTTVINCNDVKYETSMKLIELEKLLPELQFVRPHNSYLVNLSYVERIERFCLHLSNGEVLPVSNQRRPMFRDGLESYLNSWSD